MAGTLNHSKAMFKAVGGPMIPRRIFQRHIQDLPLPLKTATMVAAGFALLVTVIAYLIDAPLELPSERVSHVLGINAALPVLFGLVAYLLSQGLRRFLGQQAPSAAVVLRHTVHDLSFLLLFVVTTYYHFNLKMWMPVINPHLFDAAYFAWDQRLHWLVEGMTNLRQGIAQFLPWADQWYQLAFVLMFVLSFCYFAVGRDPHYPHFALGVLLVLSLGSLSYLIAPAVGPFLYETGVNARASEAQAGMWGAFQQVQNQGTGWIAAHGSAYFTGALAAMPSLHIAHAVVMTYYMTRSRSLLAPLFMLLTFWIVLESVASRWHYVIDAPFGLLLAGLVIWVVNRVCDPGRAARARAIYSA